MQASPWLRDAPEALISVFRERRAGLTKSELARTTGLSRTALNQRIDVLIAAGYVEPVPASSDEGRGRPAERYRLSEQRGITLVADTGATGMRVAVCSPLGKVIAEEYQGLDITEGPKAVLGKVVAAFDQVLESARCARSDVLAMGLSVPGPVDHRTQRVVRPPIMTGWDDFDIVGSLRSLADVAVFVEKDTNAMGIGDFHERDGVDNMVFVKLGTGVGTGLIVRGDIYRGSDGAAGDIGHVPLHAELNEDAPICRCGNVGCVEAYAGGWALIRDLSAAGQKVATVADVIAAVRSGDSTAVALVRRAASMIGSAVSDIVNMLNPRMVVLGGQFAELDDIVLATVREVIYGRSLPLATRNLQVVGAAADDVGVRGLARILADHLYSAQVVGQNLSRFLTGGVQRAE